LEFEHIAKVEIADKAVVEISTDNGSNWTILDTSYYTGNAIFLYGTNFFDGSYTIWDFNNNNTPSNTWWQKETFNLTSFTGSGNTQVKVRFKLESDGSFNFYGWLIDNVKISVTSTEEFDPPEITHSSLGNTGSTNVRKVEATVTDNSGIDSVIVYYRINEDSWAVEMMNNDGNGSFSFSLSGQAVGTIVDYYIKAVDNTQFKNTAYNPATAPTQYHTYEIMDAVFQYPYLEDFETNTSQQWTHTPVLAVGNTGITPYDYWEMGNPSKTYFTSPYSGSDAYVTELFSGYGDNSRSALISPVFDLGEIQNPVLSFYHRYDIDAYDGARIDYTIDDGYTWNVLGTYNDSKGTSWYNTYEIESASTPLIRPGWTGYSGNPWVQSTYTLSDYTGSGNFIQFRFAFISGFSSFWNDGWMVDDIAITDEPVGLGQVNDNSNNSIFLQIAPNPVKDITSITYSIPEKGNISLHIYNSLGQRIITSNKNEQLAGSYTETIDLANLPNGIYLYQLRHNSTTLTKKLNIAR